ncbi:MAG TPA: LamB/YcsF family protein [Rariglobus sp.]
MSIVADTVCLHGDGAGAVSFARGLRAALEHAHVTMRARA